MVRRSSCHLLCQLLVGRFARRGTRITTLASHMPDSTQSWRQQQRAHAIFDIKGMLVSEYVVEQSVEGT